LYQKRRKKEYKLEDISIQKRSNVKGKTKKVLFSGQTIRQNKNHTKAKQYCSPKPNLDLEKVKKIKS